MPIYNFREVYIDEDYDDLDQPLKAGEISGKTLEHLWWLFNDEGSTAITGKEIFKGEDTLIIQSYSYTEVVDTKKQTNCDFESNCLDGFMYEDFYIATLVCIIGVHIELMGNVVQFLEIYEVWNQHSIYTNKKVYIVKMKLYHAEKIDEIALYEIMKRNIAIDNTIAIFDIVEDNFTYSHGDNPNFANAYQRKPLMSSDSKTSCKVPYIAVTEDCISTTLDDSFMDIDSNFLIKVLKRAIKSYYE